MPPKIQTKKQTLVIVGLTIFFIAVLIGIQYYFNFIAVGSNAQEIQQGVKQGVAEEAATRAEDTAKSAARTATKAQDNADKTRDAAEQVQRDNGSQTK